MQLKSKWEARIQRAAELISVYPFCAEVLRFYAQVSLLQEKLYLEFQQRPLGDELNAAALAPKFAIFTRSIRQIAPAALAEAADQVMQEDPASQSALLGSFWLAPSAILDGEHCLAWLFLQPAAECLYAWRGARAFDESSTTCPRCGSRPIVGVLRPEGDGAKKSLVCMLCAHEWCFRRIGCPACGETSEPQIAIYSAPEIPHVRVDVCDTCRTYLKCVDFTKTGLADPIVDELATMPLDLWARENGYQKLQMNLAGI